MISREDITRVKEAADIADLIARSGVTLKNAGGNSMKGLCPFHDEKSPSFNVRPTHGTYRCFGCGQSGDAITYVQEQQGMSFIDAVRYVAEMYGVDIQEEEDDSYDGPSRKRLLSLMALTAEFFSNNYSELAPTHPAREELKKRDLDMFASSSGVGYAPDGWTTTKDHLMSQGYTEEDLLAVGLINRSNKEGSDRTYDAFRGRLTWSIKDISGRVIGFGARKLFDSDGGPKYLNTPETILYHKSRVLYNLDVARTTAAKQSLMYVVEGYTDVMALNAAGIYNVVASCGTAFGENHATTVRRIVGDSGSIVFCFDGDAAGLKAARKTFELKAPIHAQSSAVMFHNGDPCDIRVASGNSGLIQAIEEGRSPLMSFVLKHELTSYDVNTSEGRSQYLKTVAPLLATISDTSLRDDYITKVTLWSGSTLKTTQSVVQNAIREARYANNQYAPTASDDAPPPDDYDGGGYDEGTLPAEKTQYRKRLEKLLAVIIQYPDSAYRAEVHKRVNIDIFDDEIKPFASQVITLIEENPGKLESLHPERSRNPELMQSLLHVENPILSRMERMGKNSEAAAQRVITQQLNELDAYLKNEAFSRVRTAASSNLTEDTLEDVQKSYRNLHKRKYT